MILGLMNLIPTPTKAPRQTTIPETKIPEAILPTQTWSPTQTKIRVPIGTIFETLWHFSPLSPQKDKKESFWRVSMVHLFFWSWRPDAKNIFSHFSRKDHNKSF